MSKRETHEGKVKYYDDVKCFGFILPEGEEDKRKGIFFLYKDIVDNYGFFGVGDEVTFEIIQEKKGPRAINVVLL